MSVESALKKEGIEVISALDTLKVNSIAKNIAQKLVAGFPELNFKLGELFILLSRIRMYTAKVPNGLSEANYFYKNCSIYFNKNIPFDSIDRYAMHECIHYLQEKKDNGGNLIRLGLCDLTGFKVYGLGLNEAAVQLATSVALGSTTDTVKYYGLSFDTISPNCYPLECNLISQMAYITGEKILFDSTFNSNNNFKNLFIELTSEDAFYQIQDNFDKILYAEEKLIKLNNKLESIDENSYKIPYINHKILKLKEIISRTFISTQNLIISSYFDKAFNNISNLEEVENFRRKLYNYKNLIGVSDNDNYFNSYYIEMMDKLELLYNKLESNTYPNINQSLYIVKPNKFLRLIQAIKKLLYKSGDEYKNNNN